MKSRELLKIVGDEPVFETGLLLSREVDPADVQRQLFLVSLPQGDTLGFGLNGQIFKI